MRLLFILENYYPNIGGVETLFQSLMEELAKIGHDITLITHRLKGTKTYEELNGVKIHRINSFHSRYLFSFLAIPKSITLARKADIIHTTTYNGALPAIIASKLTGKHALITVHEILGKYWDTFKMGFLGRKFHKFAESMITKMPFNMFVAVSHSTKKQLIQSGIEEEKIRVVYDGVDYALLNPKKYNGNSVRKKLGLEKKFVYIAYGRPGITKGMEYLVRAVPIIEKNIPDSQLVLILSERDKRIEYIRRLIRDLGLENKIILLKSMKKEELLAHIKMADAVVVPSLTEGFGYSAIEGCEMGKIVVASNTTSIPEVMYGRYVLVKPADPKAIAAGVSMAKNKKTLTGERKVFTVEDNVAGYVQIYETLIKKKFK